MALSASPLNATAAWSVALPAERPIRLTRSLDGGSSFVAIATLSEAWTDGTFIDHEVPATSYPLYDYTPGE